MATTVVDGRVRIERAFATARAERRLAIVVYITVGFPDRASTAALLRAALDGGADIIELGVPFSRSARGWHDGPACRRDRSAQRRDPGRLHP